MYRNIVQKRSEVNTKTILAKTEALQAIISEFKTSFPDITQFQETTDKISRICADSEAIMSKHLDELSQCQKEVRKCALLQTGKRAETRDRQLLETKVCERDAAREKLCNQLQSCLTSLVACACDPHVQTTEGRQQIEKVLEDLGKLNIRFSKLFSLEFFSGDIFLKQRLQYSMVNSVESDANITGLAVSNWHKWVDSLQYEQLAEASDVCMQTLRCKTAGEWAAALGLDLNEQQQEESIHDALIAASEAIDREAAMQVTDPMLSMPCAQLFWACNKATIQIIRRYKALNKDILLHDKISELHHAESQCLNGSKFVEKQKAIENVQQEQQNHELKLGELEVTKVFARNPTMARSRDMSQEQVQELLRKDKTALRDAAEKLRGALTVLMDIQEEFPEVCVYIKSGLPRELMSVWRSDLSMDLFEVLETLPTESNHKVYKATMDGRTFALKVFELKSDKDMKSLMTEAAILRKMHHPAIVEIISMFEDKIQQNKRILLQMPFFEHGSLDKWIGAEAPTWQAVRTVLLDVVGALEYLHSASIVHCDVKPSNILVSTGCRGRLADFDISVDETMRTTKLFAATRIGYTAGFDAPELLE
jgi:hypothetical protein